MRQKWRSITEESNSMGNGLLRSGATALATAAALLFALSFASLASGAPQGRWLLPASDLSNPLNLATDLYITTFPDGTVAASWTDAVDGAMLATRPPRGSFGVPTVIAAEAASNQAIVTAPDGTVTALWIYSPPNVDNPPSIVRAASRPPGGSFGAPMDLSEPQGAAFDLQVVTAPDGTATAIWAQNNGGYVAAATRPPGGVFGAPVEVAPPTGVGRGLVAGVSPDGTVTVVYLADAGAEKLLMVVTRPPGGDFGVPVELCCSDRFSDVNSPQIAVAADGTVTIVWRRLVGENFGQIIESVTRTPDGDFEDLEPLSIPTTSFLSPPRLAVSPDGTVTVVWSRRNNRDFGGAQSATRPPGGYFESPVDIAFGFYASPELTVSPDGTVTVVIEGRTDGDSNSTVSAVTRPPGGFFGAAVGLSSVLQNAGNPSITASSDGTVTAIWSRFKGGEEFVNDVVQTASTAQPGPMISNVEVSGPSKVEKGRTASYTVAITNAGDSKVTGVSVIARGTGITSSRATLNRINAGATRTVNLQIQPSRTGRIDTTFRVVSTNGGSRTVSKTITVRE